MLSNALSSNVRSLQKSTASSCSCAAVRASGGEAVSSLRLGCAVHHRRSSTYDWISSRVCVTDGGWQRCWMRAWPRYQCGAELQGEGAEGCLDGEFAGAHCQAGLAFQGLLAARGGWAETIDAHCKPCAVWLKLFLQILCADGCVIGTQRFQSV